MNHIYAYMHASEHKLNPRGGGAYLVLSKSISAWWSDREHITGIPQSCSVLVTEACAAWHPQLTGKLLAIPPCSGMITLQAPQCQGRHSITVEMVFCVENVLAS